jgi:hypothetical protein
LTKVLENPIRTFRLFAIDFRNRKSDVDHDEVADVCIGNVLEAYLPRYSGKLDAADSQPIFVTRRDDFARYSETHRLPPSML